MSSAPPHKRRRLENQSAALSKPFKSPFKSPLKAKTDTENNKAAPISSPTKENPRAATSLIDSSSSPPSRPPPTLTPLSRRPPATHSPPSSEIFALQKKHTHLLNQLSAARTNLETSNQALKIESSNRDVELEGLVLKWRLASRAAAEEVFSGARDKVNKMGGVGAMRDRERQKQETAWGWEKEPNQAGSDDEEDPRVDNDTFHEDEGSRDEQDEREEGARKVEVYGDEEEGYTMDMMLRTLNVDLDLIGYDKFSQRWSD
ncbi:hypothetical protein MMC21_000917 [Puttea exsequens]|nr:hypothetical protein [Puttea exsequens]